MADKNKKDGKKLVSGLSKKKLPLVSHTKGFYRFSKAYPSSTDENGYRNNESTRQRPMTRQQRLLIYTAVILLFAAAFIITSVSLNISNREPEQRQEQEIGETAEEYEASEYYYSGT